MEHFNAILGAFHIGILCIWIQIVLQLHEAVFLKMLIVAEVAKQFSVFH
jgi:hypothetical protein